MGEHLFRRGLSGGGQVVVDQPAVRCLFVRAKGDHLGRGDDDPRADGFELVHGFGVEHDLAVMGRDDQADVLFLTGLEHLGDVGRVVKSRGVEAVVTELIRGRSLGHVRGKDLAR